MTLLGLSEVLKTTATAMKKGTFRQTLLLI